MKVKLIAIGLTEKGYLTEGIDIFLKRLKHYIGFELIEIAEPKVLSKLNPEQRKAEETKLFLSKISDTAEIFLLDEVGKGLTSEQFADFLSKKMLASCKEINFLVGGPFGFHEDMHKKAVGLISLSKMTFSHQMVRLFFVEQVYRAFTIIKGEKYHNP
ncbi:MAG: 23S rRNA (pseudouridine(1915)-N(3))-methyltransferase RlmH [Luteibaculaceae bacterium]